MQPQTVLHCWYPNKMPMAYRKIPHKYIQKKLKLHFGFLSDSTHHHRNYLVTVKIPKVLGFFGQIQPI